MDTEANHAGEPTDGPLTRAYREASAQMHQAMSIIYTGDVDTDFLRGMIVHHEGPLAMAKIALQHSEVQDVRGLAAHEVEIVRRRILLARHEERPAPDARP
ncbi:MAG: DUF305 domain-containing protein [Proteobacteria bacterium]|nr:DUF305 domain-containing protein [Pseudomonadota bacterium]